MITWGWQGLWQTCQDPGSVCSGDELAGTSMPSWRALTVGGQRPNRAERPCEGYLDGRHARELLSSLAALVISHALL